jgi:apolipoprotein D and lipocalin family protein
MNSLKDFIKIGIRNYFSMEGRKMRTLIVLFILTSGINISYAKERKMETRNELKTVDYVDLKSYLGKWYEIAKYPVVFEKNLVAVTATYSLREDGKIKVLNAGRKGSLDGKEKSAVGKAWVVDKKTNAKLKVQFFWPFSGAYWIIELGENYEYAVVGHPKRKYLWILSRTPRMDEKLYQEILKKIESHNYDLSKIEKTLQE